MGSIDEERSLLEVEEVKLYAEDGSVDIHGNPPLKQTTGNWKACPFIFGIYPLFYFTCNYLLCSLMFCL